jgi:two-component system response regulator YesN
MTDEKRTLLIVDDEPSCREAFCVALEDDYSLVEVETGEQALEILQSREDISLVLLDFLLPPGIDGLKVFERMKEFDCNIPVIIVTGKGSEKVAVEAFRLGARDYITKPFKVRELQGIIEDILTPIKLRKSLVDKAIDFMEEQYCRPISAINVARGIGVSYSHLARSFKDSKKYTVEIWLNRLRIDKAKSLLKYSNLEIKEVAAKVGFNDQNYFYQMFKKVTGKSPSEYRDDSKKCQLFAK